MLARFFSRPQINHPLVLVIIAASTTAWSLVWIPISPQAFDFWGSTITVPGVWGYIIGSALWVSMAFFWQYLGKKYAFVQDHYFWPVVMVMMGIISLPLPNYLTFSQHFAGFAMLAGMFIHRLDARRPNFTLFDLGLFIGTWALFSPLSIVWIVLLWIGLLIFGFPPLRGLILLLTGSAIALFLAATIARSIDFFGGSAALFHVLLQDLGWHYSDTLPSAGIAMSLVLLYIAPELYRSVTRSSVIRRQLAGWGIISLLLLVPLQGVFGMKSELMAPTFLFSTIFLANRFAFNKSKRRELVFYAFIILVLLYPFVADFMSVYNSSLSSIF